MVIEIKKEVDRVQSSKQKKRYKRGQITVFIIIGLMLLFAAIFVIQVAKQVQVGELEKAQEDVISKAFKKEGLRLFVEGCLEEGLEEGLRLVGKQGGEIWQDQIDKEPNFLEKENGVRHAGERIAYAIKRGDYLPDNSYPCKEGEAPAFCKYQHPNSSVVAGYPIKFGERTLSVRDIEINLKQFLEYETIECVKEVVYENFSQAIDVSTEDLDVKVDIMNEGINVDVTYPLTLSLGEEEFFNLAEFDFFYNSNFKKLLEAAITYPLNLDWSFVDFDYSEASLTSDSVVVEGIEEEKQLAMRKSLYNKLDVAFVRDP
ncbi:hypothetical protein GOV03_02775, partial [Candidatus Woesearchaeota archaeon]|nr:hypothetical protein [Candidatus Woesearchaeota archaeon]